MSDGWWASSLQGSECLSVDALQRAWSQFRDNSAFEREFLGVHPVIPDRCEHKSLVGEDRCLNIAEWELLHNDGTPLDVKVCTPCKTAYEHRFKFRRIKKR